MSAVTPQRYQPMRRGFLRRMAYFAAWAERNAMGNRLTIALVALAMLMGVLTYVAMTAHSPFSNDADTLILLLNIDLVVFLLLLTVLAKRVVALWMNRRRGVAGSALQVKLVGLFSLLVAVPAIITTIFSVGLFYYGVHGWFDQRVRTAVDESLEVAKAYLSEHQQVIRSDIQAMANDLERESFVLSTNQRALETMLDKQAFFRNFSEIILYDSDMQILGQSGLALNEPLEAPARALFEQAREGEVLIETGEDDDRIQAIMRLRNFGGGYLYATRMVDSKVLAHLDTTRAAVSQYQELAAKSGHIQVTITVLYVAVTLLLMTIAIWFGLNLARRLVTPITNIITVAERLRAGDMTARVDDVKGLEEFETLGRAFNRMTDQIESQRNELIDANQKLDYRRRFTETILGGVSTGIISLDEQGLITLVNNAAVNLLGLEAARLIGQPIGSVLPELADDLPMPQRRIERELSVFRRDGAKRRFLMRLSSDLIGETGQGTIITFDDITDLMAAQKSAAWSDVARRIAHEIKNPLTPIQLSAERIKRKYLSQLTDTKDREVLQTCTDTIVRHVEDIKSMVNSFADFAKMPDPKIALIDLRPVVREVIVFQAEANPTIKVQLDDTVPAYIKVEADAQQVRQALTNLIQNAADAIIGADQAGRPSGDIGVLLRITEGFLWLCVLDNGPGIPLDQRENVLEPYVTTKAKGTGLGLAIVRKIVEDHGGQFTMNAPFPLGQGLLTRYTGAHIYLGFPITNQTEQ